MAEVVDVYLSDSVLNALNGFVSSWTKSSTCEPDGIRNMLGFHWTILS